MNDDLITILHGDALSQLAALGNETVQSVVTSPPYFGLRDYGIGGTVWGGDANCAHDWEGERTARSNSNGGRSHKQLTNRGSRSVSDYHDRATYSRSCACGAWSGQFGLEPSPNLYIEHLVEIFREIRRVLRSDGTAWLNLGDSYFADSLACRSAARIGDLKPKDLIGVPWAAAFALRADGWWLRSDIIWAKPNPMPESITDRPTRSHEYIFLLAKSERYFYDAEAIKEPIKDLSLVRISGRTKAVRFGGDKADGYGSNLYSGNEWTGAPRANKRDVWTVTTKRFSEAHFAVYPAALIRPCILAGSRAGDIVLDPFAGSGTTGKVAIELGRKAILIEPKSDYVAMIQRRTQAQIGLPFEKVAL